MRSSFEENILKTDRRKQLFESNFAQKIVLTAGSIRSYKETVIFPRKFITRKRTKKKWDEKFSIHFHKEGIRPSGSERGRNTEVVQEFVMCEGRG
jgi:hypothetical protein